MTESKEQYNVYRKKAEKHVGELGRLIASKMKEERHVEPYNVSIQLKKDYSSTETHYDFEIMLKKSENVSATGSIPLLLEELEIIKTFMEEEFNYFFDNFKFFMDHIVLYFKVSRENMDEYPLFKSLLGLDKFNII